MIDLSTYDYDPWAILRGLGGTTTGDITSGKGAETVISVYGLLKVIGLIGIVITLLITIIKFSAGSANVRADAKSMFTKKLVIAFFIFTSAYFFGYVIGIIVNL